MEIKRTQKEDQTSLISVKVDENDYGTAVEKSLREYRRKANIPGFRPGMVPMGIIKKMYGKGVVAEQSYRTASNAVFEYLQKEGIDFLGDVIPAEEQGAFDFDNATEFEYMFEIGEAPKIELNLSTDDHITYTTIEIDKQMHDNYRSNFLRRYGRLVDVETVEADEALTVTLDNEAMRIEEAYVGLISMSEEERKPFIGKKVGDKMSVNINELYKNPAQRAAALQVKENELEGINPEFSLEITKIRKFADPELNEEFFKTAFPQGNVTTEAELDSFVDAEIGKELTRESDYMFTLQLRDFLLAKAALKMPEAFLKRWLWVINEEKFTKEEIEKDFDQFLKMFTWNYLQKYFIKEDNITVTADEALEEAKAFAAAQFAQYGMPGAPADMLENFAKQQILANKEQSQKIYEKLYETKVVAAVKSRITVTETKVSAEEFAKQAKEM
jgi:trigger factor